MTRIERFSVGEWVWFRMGKARVAARVDFISNLDSGDTVYLVQYREMRDPSVIPSEWVVGTALEKMKQEERVALVIGDDLPDPPEEVKREIASDIEDEMGGRR